MKTCLNCLEKLEIKAYIESPAQGLLPCCAGDDRVGSLRMAAGLLPPP